MVARYRASGAALMCAALLTLSSSAEAEPILTERLRLQGGAFTEARPAPQPRLDSVYVGAVPELVLSWVQPGSLVSLSYSLTGGLSTLGGTTELSNRLVAMSMWDLSRRTTLLLSAEAAQSSFSNLLISNTASTSNVALFPAAENRVVSTRVSQAIGYELSPRMRLSQGADAGFITSIPPTPSFETFTAGLTAGIERVWRSDGIGLDVSSLYANTTVPPPAPSQALVTLTGSPHWRHDWTNSLNTVVAAGASVLFPVGDTAGDSQLAPFGRASATYFWQDTTFGLGYFVGITSSPLTGQVLRSDQITANVFTPISQRERVSLGASAGVLRGTVLDLANPANNQEFDALMTDVDLTWQATNFVSLFARYQFIAQLGNVNTVGLNPSFLRDFFLIGVQFSSRPAGGDTIPSRFPQRVDGADGRSSVGGGAKAPPK